MLCLCFYVFLIWPGDSKHLGSAGRQADEYIAPGGKFFMLFMYLILPIWTGLSSWAQNGLSRGVNGIIAPDLRISIETATT